MAGIEKCCEVCGFIPINMYHLKLNHIQVCMECRKKFSGQKATLILFKPPSWDRQYVTRFRNGRYIDFTLYEYCLVVPNLEGDVHGSFYNQTADRKGFNKIVRRMRNLVGRDNLSVVVERSIMADYINYQRKKRDSVTLPAFSESS